MRHLSYASAILGAFVLSLTVGCDTPPAPPEAGNSTVPDVLYVRAGNDAELATVTAVEKARVNYRYRLDVLRQFFLAKGMMDQCNWAAREMKNLDDSVTFRWANIPQIDSPAGESFEKTDAKALVEATIAARKTYLAVLDELVQFYERQDKESYKARRVRNAQARFDPVHTYLYFLEAEIPGPELRPTEVIPEADRLYEQAMKLYKSGQVGPGITNYDKERQALVLFQKLVHDHPASTKIALSAFFLGEIYKEYFKENVLAVNWYERAWQWDPTITEAARFQAAAIYDLRLHNFTKAVELYREALKYDPPRLGNARFCRERIKELIEQGKVQPPANP